MADDTKKTAEEIAAAAEAAGVAAEHIEAFAAAMERGADQGEAIRGLIEQINKLSESQSGTLSEHLEKDAQRLSLLEDILVVARSTSALSREEIALEREAIKEKQKINKLLAEENEKMEDAKELLIGKNKAALSLKYHFAAISDIWNNMSREEAINRVLNTTVDLMASVGKKIFEASMEFDTISAKVAKATSTTQFAGAMEDLRVEALAAGVSVEQLGENFITLNNNFSDFNRLDAESAKQIASTATALNAAGFSAEAFANTLDLGVKALNMSTDQVETFSKELVSFGTASGISMERLSKDLSTVGPKLVTFGSQGERVFKEMSLASKNLGIELNRMFDIAERYTTFEGAADAAAKLNSVLGGNFINSLDLMNASLDDPTETFRLMKQSMDASGKSFDDMTPAMKKVIAEAAGFSDVSEAARIFNMDIDEGSAALEEQAITQEKLNEMNRSFISLQEKLNKLMAEFTPVMTPVIEGLGKIVDWFAGMGKEGKEVVFWLGAIALSITALSFAIQFVMKVAAGFSVIKAMFNKKPPAEVKKELEEAGDGVKSFGKKFGELAQSVKGSWKEMLAFGGAILLIGGGIAIASYGLAELVKSFSVLTGEQILGALGALTIVMGGFVLIIYAMIPAIVALGATTAPVIVPLLALGAAFFLIGAGVGVAALGMAQLVTSLPPLVELVKALSQINVLQMLLLGPALSSIAVGLAALTAVGTATGLAGLFGAGPLGTLKELSELATDTFANNMEKIAISVERIVSALSTTINTNLIEQLEKMEGLAAAGAFKATPAAVSATPAVISVQDIVVKNTIRSEENGRTGIEKAPINITLTVPVKIDGSEFKNVVAGITKSEIRAESDRASSVNIRTA